MCESESMYHKNTINFYNKQIFTTKQNKIRLKNKQK